MENTASRRRGRPPRGMEEVTEQVSEQVSSVPRTEMRAPMREDDSRARAARRAAELRGHLSNLDEGTDEFYISSDEIPDGWTYEWKVRTIYGAENPSEWTQIERTGWTPVPLERHPHMMPSQWQGGIIERKGMVLMERPEEITEEMQSIEVRKARDQVRAKEAQLSGTPDGTMTRDHAQVRPSIKKSFEAVPIPKE